MDERGKRLYGEMLRDKLRKRNPEHSKIIDALSDDRIIQLDQEHQARKVEVFATRIRDARRRAGAETIELL